MHAVRIRPDLHADDLNLALPSPLALTPTGTRPTGESRRRPRARYDGRAPAPLPVVGIAPETTYLGLFRAWSARVLDALTFDVAPGATIRLWAQPPESAADSYDRLPPVPLRVVLEADRARRWVRRVRVELEPL